MNELSSLVLEISTGRANCLSKLCDKKSIKDIDDIICLILKIFLFFESENLADLPTGLIYQKDRFWVEGGGSTRRESFSKGSLKHYLFKILRRLFECCKESDLKHRPWLNEEPKNIFTCIRDLTLSISVQMYLMNGLQVKHPARSLPRVVVREVKSVALDFVEKFGDSMVIEDDDASFANIACSFMIKYYEICFKVAHHVFMHFLIANAKQHSDHHWPFMKTLAKLIDLDEDKVMSTTGLLPSRLMKEVGVKICKDVIKCLSDESFQDDQVCVLVFILKHHGESYDPTFCAFRQAVKECFFDDPLIVEKSFMSNTSLKSRLKCLFFHYFSFASVDNAALQWISCVGFDQMLTDYTDLLLCGLAEYFQNTCPANFIANLLHIPAAQKTPNWTCPLYDWKRIVTSKEFIDFVAKSIFLSNLSSNDKVVSGIMYFILKTFDSPTLLQLSIQSGLFGCFKDATVFPSDFALGSMAAELILTGLKFEQDPIITKFALNLAIPKSLNVWKKWSKLDAQRFLDRHLMYLELNSVENLVEMFLKHAQIPNLLGFLHLLLLMIGPKRGIEISNLDLSSIKLDLSDIPWLTINESDAIDCKLKKQLILGKVDIYDSVRYFLDNFNNQLSQRLKLQLSSRIPLAIELEPTVTASRSCVLEYASGLLGSRLRCCANPKNLLHRDFWMLDLLEKYNLSSNVHEQIEALSQLPLAIFSNYSSLLAHFLHLMFKSPRELRCRGDWKDGLAWLASDRFK